MARRVPCDRRSDGSIRAHLFAGDITLRRGLSLTGLSAAVWRLCWAFEGLRAGQGGLRRLMSQQTYGEQVVMMVSFTETSVQTGLLQCSARAPALPACQN